MDRASDFGSEGWGFESLRARLLASATVILPNNQLIFVLSKTLENLISLALKLFLRNNPFI